MVRGDEWATGAAGVAMTLPGETVHHEACLALSLGGRTGCEAQPANCQYERPFLVEYPVIYFSEAHSQNGALERLKV